MQNSTRRVFGLGVAAGVGAAALVAVGIGAGRLSGGESFVTSSADGRRAYMWTSDGASLRFVASAEAPKGQDEHGKADDEHKHADHDKPDDKGKPDDGGKPDDKGKGKGKNK